MLKNFRQKEWHIWKIKKSWPCVWHSTTGVLSTWNLNFVNHIWLIIEKILYNFRYITKYYIKNQNFGAVPKLISNVDSKSRCPSHLCLVWLVCIILLFIRLSAPSLVPKTAELPGTVLYKNTCYDVIFLILAST